MQAILGRLDQRRTDLDLLIGAHEGCLSRRGVGGRLVEVRVAVQPFAERQRQPRFGLGRWIAVGLGGRNRRLVGADRLRKVVGG